MNIVEGNDLLRRSENVATMNRALEAFSDLVMWMEDNKDMIFPLVSMDSHGKVYITEFVDKSSIITKGESYDGSRVS